MAKALPLAPFIGAGALADRPTFRTQEEEAAWFQSLGIGALSGEVNKPLPPVRSLVPPVPRRPGPVGPNIPLLEQQQSPGVMVPFGGDPQSMAGIGGLMQAVMSQQQPQQPQQQPPGNWDLQHEELPPDPVYPHVQPDLDRQIAQSPGPQGNPQNPSSPQTQQVQPWSYRPPETQQEQSQAPFSSDAGMWGLIAAGLGILANNTGNYGQAGPAIGRGGLIGLNTFLGQRQQDIENKRRNELAAAATAQQEALARYRDDSIGIQRGQLSLKEQEEARKQRQDETRKAIALSLAGDDPVMQKLAAADTDVFLKYKVDSMKPEYRERSVKDGDTAFDEYSTNNGKNWNKVPGGGKYKLRDARGGTEINLKNEIKQAEAFTKPIAESVNDSYTQARSAVAAQTTLNGLEKNLENPALIAGPMANKRLTIEQVKNFFGGGSDEGLAVTRSTVQGLSELTLQSRNMLKGQGAVTDRETALLERARSGDIEMTVPELKELVRVLSRMQRALYDNHMDAVGRLDAVPGAQHGKGFFTPPPYPEAYKPGSGKKDPWKK